MTTANGHPAARARSGPIARAWAAWCRFWFTPADPTPLCLMRIVAGLLTLYVHVAYTFDLHALFGPNAWLPTEVADRERHEYPIISPSATWGPRNPPSFRMPELGDQRHALRMFIDNVARDPVGREKTFRLLGPLADAFPDGWNETFTFLRGLPRDADGRHEILKDLVQAPAADDPDRDRRFENERRFGRYLLELKPDQRAEFRTNAEKFAEMLPTDTRERNELFDVLMQNGPGGIHILSRFIGGVAAKFPTNSAADEAGRKAYLDYTENWSAAPDDPDLLDTGHPVYSPFFHVTSTWGINTIHGIHLAVIVLFIFGVCTRVTSVLTWLAGLAYIQRNPLSLFGQDTMMNLCLFYLMLAPCGATWSVDWLIARYRAARERIRNPKSGTQPETSYPRPSISANAVLRLLQVQYCIMYLSAGLSKLKGNSWWDGTAPWFCFTNPEFSPLHIPFFRNGLVFICQDQFRWLWEIVMSSMDVFTLVLEIGFPFLVWTRLRPVMVFGAILLHLGIALNMGLVVFSLLMFTLLLAWMPAGAIRRVFARPPARLPRLTVQFSAADPGQARTAAAVAAADVWDQVELDDRNGARVGEPIEVTGGGVTLAGPAAERRLLRDLGLTQSVWWLAYPLLRLPGLSHLMAGFAGPSRVTEVPTDGRKRPKPVATR
jgi:hypothetical protein